MSLWLITFLNTEGAKRSEKVVAASLYDVARSASKKHNEHIISIVFLGVVERGVA